MKNRVLYNFFYLLSILLIIIFIIMIIIDYKNYNPIITSSPFYVNILIRSLEFFLPSVIIFVVGLLLKNRK